MNTKQLVIYKDITESFLNIPIIPVKVANQGFHDRSGLVIPPPSFNVVFLWTKGSHTLQSILCLKRPS